MIKAEILVPLLNANEPEARLVGIHVSDGQQVEKGSLLFTLETTKAAADVESNEAGVVRLLAKDGDILSVGDRLAVITESAGDLIDSVLSSPEIASIPNPASTDLRITKPARELIEKMGMDLSLLPKDQLITEAVVRKFSNKTSPVIVPDIVFTNDHILIYGAGGHAKAVMEMVKSIGAFQIAGILDDNVPAGTRILDIPVLGSREVIRELVEHGLCQAANGVGGIIDINIRVKLFQLDGGQWIVIPSSPSP